MPTTKKPTPEALREIGRQFLRAHAAHLYPAESRLVDTANQYHLFVFVDPATRFPLGFQERLVTGPETAAAIGARQRAFG